MKGTKLSILVLLAVALGTVGIMYLVSGGSLKSWSISDATSLRWMLVIILYAISVDFLLVGWNHTEKEKHLFSITPRYLELFKYKPFKNVPFSMPFNNRQAFVTTGLLFVGIAVFGMGSAWYIQILHYIFTFSAAVMAFLTATHSFKGLERKLLSIYLWAAGLVWILAIVGFVFSIYFAEFMFAIGLAILFVSLVLRNKVNG